jgi:hypothetical protein
MKRNLAILFSVAFLDLLSFSLILPLLPYHAEHFGASPFILRRFPIAPQLAPAEAWP